ncbi:hypothetical protein M422DRAFT_242650 [Sphaerobolus stellatus SS14]|nr:hypothetical protein M422DRAFT_242650 [Sphaerobolus stellatus SS14]
MPLLNLPIDVIDTILSDIDRASDLLALSLTCRTLYSCVIPDLLPFPDASASIQNVTIWNHLLQYPDKAKRIRSISLHHRLSSTLSLLLGLPDTVVDSTEGFGCILQALSLMDGLKYLHFEPGKDKFPEFIQWLSEGGTQTIKRISISWEDYCEVHDISEMPIQDVSFSLALTHISVSGSLPTAASQILNLENILLHQCPKLLYLKIRNALSIEVDLFRLIRIGSWPKLQTLCLEGSLNLSGSNDSVDGLSVMTSFLRRHPALERLSVQPWGDSWGRWLESDIVELEHSDVSSAMLPSLQYWILTGEAAKMLSLLRGQNSAGVFASRSEESIRHLQSFTSLKSLGTDIVDLTEVPKLLKSLPNLTRLQLHLPPGRPTRDQITENLIRPLRIFSNITHLGLYFSEPGSLWGRRSNGAWDDYNFLLQGLGEYQSLTSIGLPNMFPNISRRVWKDEMTSEFQDQEVFTAEDIDIGASFGFWDGRSYI